MKIRVDVDRIGELAVLIQTLKDRCETRAMKIAAIKNARDARLITEDEALDLAIEYI